MRMRARRGWGTLVVVLASAAAMLAACSDDGPRLGQVPTTSPPAGSTTTSPGPTYAEPTRLATVDIPGLTESSGLVASRKNPGVLWTHNDSGGEPVLHCLRSDGSSCGTLAVTGAENLDWEDLAIGPGPEPGTDHLYVADIGDNQRVRSEVVVYRVMEPEVPPDASNPTALASEPAEVLRLAYPEGPVDAETLLVHPVTGAVTILTKEVTVTRVFSVAPPAPGTTAVLEPVARLDIGFANARSRLVTGGDISPDGSRVVMCTYAEGYELTLTEGQPWDEIWSQTPKVVRLAARDQGEAIAYRADGAGILTTSEGRPFPLHVVVRT